MPRFIGPTELIIILVIVVLIFGVGKLGDVGGALGKSIREFKKGMGDDEKAAGKEDAAAEKHAEKSVKE